MKDPKINTEIPDQSAFPEIFEWEADIDMWPGDEDFPDGNDWGGDDDDDYDDEPYDPEYDSIDIAGESFN